MIRQYVSYLCIMKGYFTWRVLNVISNITWAMGNSLLPLAEEGLMPRQGCKFSVQPSFSKQALLSTYVFVLYARVLKFSFGEIPFEIC